MDESRHDLTERARQTAQDAQAKFDNYKNAAEQSLANARKASEQKFEQTKDAVGDRADEVKDVGHSWFSWGQMKTDEKKREGAQKVAESTEEIGKRAEKHT